ncbi:hypothetical protein Droror1_Dr00007648 [Drosera rotundifolia]
MTSDDKTFGRLPDHLLVEIFIRVPVSDWVRVSCVKKLWASLFRCDSMWQAALLRGYPFAESCKRWPGPIPQGLSRRRFAALYVTSHILALDTDLDEVVGHTFLFLKDQLEISDMPPSLAILHGTMIDQFIACGRARDEAHELASCIWLGVIGNLEENENTFLILKRLAFQGNVFLPYPYARSEEVQWRVFEKLFTDFRGCLSKVDYYDLLASAKSRFQFIPSTWLGY